MNANNNPRLDGVIDAATRDIAFRPDGFLHVVNLLGDRAPHYLSAINPHIVTIEMRNLLADPDNPLSNELRPYFILNHNNQNKEN